MSDEKVNIPDKKKEFKRSAFHKIVSGFILLAVVVIALLLLSIGFAQTSWFRSIAREKIIETVNENINGEFYLKSVNGTFINSLKLNDFGVVVNGDTLLSCKEAYLKLSLQALLVKKIFISKAWLEKPVVKFLENENGKWNLSALLKNHSGNKNLGKNYERTEQTTRGDFPFIFEIGDLEIKKGNFLVKDFAHLQDDSIYKYVNYRDLLINNLNLKVNAVGDINKNEFALFLKNLSFDDNLKRFSLKQAKGIFLVKPDLIEVKYLNVKTDSSSITLSTKFKGLNLFNKIIYSDFKKYPVSFSMTASPFRFSDLSTFLPSVSFLRGAIAADLKVSGKYGKLKIDKLKLKRGYTDLNLTGELKNLEKPKDLYIDAKINKSRIDYGEVRKLLAGLNLPEYKKLRLDSINIHYYGKPIKFNADIAAKADKGHFNAKTFFDFTGKEMIYDVALNCKMLDLFPVIKKKTFLNLSAGIAGKGTNPKTMENSLRAKIVHSKLNGYNINLLNCDTHSAKGVSDVAFSGEINGARFSARSHIGLLPENREYTFSSRINNLDLSKITFDSTLASNLNFNINFSSEALEKNNVDGEINVRFDSSLFRGTPALSNTHWQINFWGDSTKKNFDLESELLDASIEGDFNYHELPPLVATQGSRIAKLFIDEIRKQFYANYSADTLRNVNLVSDLPKLKLKYDFLIKNSDLPEKVLNLKKLRIDGYFKGSIFNDKKKFSFVNNTFLENFVMLNNSKLYYTKNFQFETNIKNVNTEDKIDNLTIYAKMNADNLFAEREILSPNFLIDLKNGDIAFNFSATVDTNYAFVSQGEINVTDTSDKIKFEKLSLTSYGEKWENNFPFNLSAAHGTLKINNFNLQNDSALIKIKGVYNSNGINDISIDAENVSLDRVLTSAIGSKENDFAGNINMHGKIFGAVSNPSFTGALLCEDFTFRNKNFGDLKFTEAYSDGISTLSLNLKDKKDFDRLTLKGTLPYALFGETEVNGGKQTLSFAARDFDLSALAKFIPSLANQTGILNSSISISGDLKNPVLNGFAKIEKGKFKVSSTGMDYNIGADFVFKNNLISINKMFVETGKKSKLHGRVDFGGSFLLDHYKFREFSVTAAGELPLLDERSRYASPDLYGSLIIGTNGKLRIEYMNDRALLKGNLIIKQGDITLSNESSASSVDVSNIDYVYYVDSTKINQTELLLKNYLAEKFSESEIKNISGETLFDYDLNLSIENRASLTFIFSKTVNQKLYVITNGSLLISNLGGNQSVQGTFNLLPGSRLEFFRTFDATGYVRFEGDLSNPYFNIEAVYEGNYVSSSSTSNDVEKLVAVKIKLDGTLKELAKKLATDKSNISVYVGKKNIDNNVADPQLSASDAFSFILTGKFSRDLTSNERYQLSSELANTATSMLGSVMAGFLNAQVGDLINDIQVKQSDYFTKITLKGRVGGFYYSVGGSQQVFQDLSTATWRLEYFFNKNLSFRVERREPLTGYFSNTQMTDEIAIKYKVTF